MLFNFWKVIFTLFVIIGTALLLTVFEYYLRKKNEGGSAHNFFKGLKVIFRWNLFLLIFCTNIDGVVLFSSLELRSTNFNTATDIFSFILCLGFILLGIGVLGFTIYLVKNSQQRKGKVFFFDNKKNRQAIIDYHNKYKAFHVLFMGFKDHNFLKQAFLLIFVLRIVIFNMIIGILTENPLTQAILITLLSFLMLLYLLTFRPFKRTINLF
mmetsp:Transcript_29645/g.27095  ORF Transcript_29645/g.27095 Transcript_29645/m.27095 type:complete len:211 (+) Transcript_29645:1144-1776(+)